MNVVPPNPNKKPVDGAVLAGDVYACQQCLYDTTDRSHMVRHILSRHTRGKKKINRHGAAPSKQCAKCRKTFATAFNRVRHEQTCSAGPATAADLRRQLTRLEHELARVKAQLDAMPAL